MVGGGDGVGEEAICGVVGGRRRVGRKGGEAVMRGEGTQRGDEGQRRQGSEGAVAVGAREVALSWVQPAFQLLISKPNSP